ncbi:MAG: family 78 glycoside hydrolase catalytic domain, partial [Bacteroidota bacterium]|nr:family 78 glycoside hydrolase catalytic domain [Bacteroidota bacterium]
MLNNKPIKTPSLSFQTQQARGFAASKHKRKRLIKEFVFALFLLLSSIVSFAQVSVKYLLTENRTNPIGLDIASPRFSWQLEGNERNIVQTAYEIEVSNNGKNKPIVWNSGKVMSDSSVHLSYKGLPLERGKHYNWKVRVWDGKNKASNWSETAFFQTALLNETDWKAQWIEPGYTEDSVHRPSPLFRKEFTANKKITSATAYITAHGLYEAQLNGVRIGDAYLTPGWTSYHKRLQYQTYDVTNLIKNGSNAIGVTLGSGWYRGIIGFGDNINIYGKDIALLMQINIRYSDGSTGMIITDSTWKSTTGVIRYAEIYNGETIDHRAEKKGWTFAGYNDKEWSGVKVGYFGFANLLATYNEPVRKHEIFTPVQIITTPKGEKVIDFGQNLVGWVMVKVRGNAGDTIAISHAEVLDKKGNFYTANLREAKAQDQYILKGGEEESFEPNFTWHGFRYIKIEGYKGEIKPADFTAVTLYSDMPQTGSFSTSNALINQLQHNIQWGQKGNFLDVPTDCPQRDERLGWTGDAQVFSRTASFNMNVNDFFAKWLQDVAADQYKGSVPFVIPNVLGNESAGSTGWADVATIVPWNMYLAYGDKNILQNQYSSMKQWVDFMTSKSKNNLWQTGFHFGDWLFYRPEDDNDGRSAVTDKYLIAQCFYAHS